MENKNRVRPIDILLVEDEQADVDLLVEALEESKIYNNISVVTDGIQALAYLRKEGKYSNKERPDLIFLDLNLPSKSGNEVLREIKEDSSLKMIPVVVMTSSDAEEDIVKSYEHHANCYVEKPVDIDQLKKIVKGIEEFWFSIVSLAPKP